MRLLKDSVTVAAFGFNTNAIKADLTNYILQVSLAGATASVRISWRAAPDLPWVTLANYAADTVVSLTAGPYYRADLISWSGTAANKVNVEINAQGYEPGNFLITRG